MRTKFRLDEVFKDAFPIPFDNTSKYVFFGDIHRGDDSLSDEFGRNRHIYYHALNYYYQNDCTYVEVGDGDELMEVSDFKHIYTAHFQTFEMLKKFHEDSRLIMLYGNHNRQLMNPEFVKKTLYQVYDEYSETYEDLFPDLVVHEALILKHRETGQEIFVVHGHQGDLISDQLWWLSYFTIRYFWRFMHALGIKYAATPAQNRNRRHKVEINYNKWNQQRDIMIICGHTHRPKYPKPHEPAYFNTGCCIHPRGITCLEIICGEVILVSWRMHSKTDGTLYIKRTILQGPEPVEYFQSSLRHLTGKSNNMVDIMSDTVSKIIWNKRKNGSAERKKTDESNKQHSRNRPIHQKR